MAYIYRYQLKNKQARYSTNLLEYKDYIVKVIENIFFNKLKDIRVSEKFFEFKLYYSVGRTDLQNMGRRLSHIGESENRKHKGFSRMQQEFYVIVYPNEDNHKLLYSEFIDVLDMSNTELFSKRAKEYTLKHIKGIEGMAKERIIEDTKIQNALYVDILTSLVKRDAKFFYGEVINGISCFKIKGYHRSDMLKDEHLQYIHFESNKSNKNNENYLKVTKCEKLEDNIIEYIKEKFDYIIEKTDKVESLNNIKPNDKLVFTVHNVGQGLATSLMKEDNRFLYFDFGMAEGENYHTKPQNISANIEEKSTIILSHIHRDHWFRLTEEINAFKCNWYIPDQDKNIDFRNKFAKIIVNGGSVYTLVSRVNFNGGILFCGGESKYKAGRPTRHKHENGISLRLECKTENNENINVLVVGDQRYDYIEDKYLKDIDILVASHHGGEYSWSKRKEVKNDIPTPKTLEKSIVVYSYGLGDDGTKNTHDHPSKTSDYESRGWNKSHHTAITGDYKIELIIG